MVEAVKGILYPEVKDRAKVTEEVIGFPEILNPVGTVISTEVTADPTYKDPADVDLTKPAPRELIVVEPFALTCKSMAFVEEATTKGAVEPATPFTLKVPIGVEEFIPTKADVVFG